METTAKKTVNCRVAQVKLTYRYKVKPAKSPGIT
ncbi:hypothetical protein FHS90_001840 [Rufibacter quisquiliarum]|uniref:Uncharacterized protein n=1 Tax=Rufibacter quisquiliarum TaxID=1549639 RepID=A0A839GK20_9BACT|nr:hypothetical protein [Rufibacter quisquiliarum]